MDGREAYMALTPEAKELIAVANAVAVQLTPEEELEAAVDSSAVVC
jgi:hypothetical protein